MNRVCFSSKNAAVRNALWWDKLYIGALIPGYPRLERTDPGFNEQFWKIYHQTIST